MKTLPGSQKSASGNYTTGVTLTSAGNNPLVFNGTVTYTNTEGSSSYIGLYLASPIAWTVTNNGFDYRRSRTGVADHGTGTVTNAKFINGATGTGVGMFGSGTVANSGTITGQEGVYLKAGGGVTNTGRITGDGGIQVAKGNRQYQQFRHRPHLGPTKRCQCPQQRGTEPDQRGHDPGDRIILSIPPITPYFPTAA